jgi:CO/xanthine dehydrogenase FAD-binding subunit
MDILKPKTLDEAVDLLAQGAPLAGGTGLTPRRSELHTVVDLQGLGLDQLEEDNGTFTIGAMTRLQDLMTDSLPFPEVFKDACRYEAAWNLRNQATLGGLLSSGDARSPLLTALAALDPRIHLAPGNRALSFNEFIDLRQGKERSFLVLRCTFDLPQTMAFDSVARAPMDLPLVCASAACYEVEDGKTMHLAVGGFGEAPRAWSYNFSKVSDDLVTTAADQAGEFYQKAGDDFASAEYRSEVAQVLTRRVVEEVLQAC